MAMRIEIQRGLRWCREYQCLLRPRYCATAIRAAQEAADMLRHGADSNSIPRWKLSRLCHCSGCEHRPLDVRGLAEALECLASERAEVRRSLDSYCRDQIEASVRERDYQAEYREANREKRRLYNIEWRRRQRK